jgi:hypothetical protein
MKDELIDILTKLKSHEFRKIRSKYHGPGDLEHFKESLSKLIDKYPKETNEIVNIWGNDQSVLHPSEYKIYSILILTLEALYEIEETCKIINGKNDENGFSVNHKNKKKQIENIKKMANLHQFRIHWNMSDFIKDCDIIFDYMRTPTEIRWELGLNLDRVIDQNNYVITDPKTKDRRFDCSQLGRHQTVTMEIFKKIFHRERIDPPSNSTYKYLKKIQIPFPKE